MGKNSVRKRIAGVFVVAAIFSASPTMVAALTSSSENYQMTETQFDAGTTLESCSGEYCTQATIGDVAEGKSKSANSTASFGSIKENEPMLEVIIDPGESDLGELSTERTASKTSIIKIRNYLSSGYTLQINGEPPKYDDHTLNTPSSPVASALGTEQFGINIAKNTTPSVGADPVQTPSSETSFGIVEDDYKTPNRFKYESGDVVAHSKSESGQTDYTISMIVNIANSTPAGHYDGEYSAIVTPVY